MDATLSDETVTSRRMTLKEKFEVIMAQPEEGFDDIEMLLSPTSK